MNVLKISGIYQVVIGTGMAGIWFLHFLKGEVPELQTEPARIAMHLVAEAVTGLMLCISGFFILFTRKKMRQLFNISFGALIYTLIASPGYFAQNGQWGAVALFLVLLASAVGLLVIQGKDEEKHF